MPLRSVPRRDSLKSGRLGEGAGPTVSGYQVPILLLRGRTLGACRYRPWRAVRLIGRDSFNT